MLKKVFSLLFTSYLANALTSTTKFNQDMPQDISTYVPHHPSVDNSTYGNIDEIATTHYHVDWYINFGSSTLMGWIIHDMTVKADNTLYVQLDSWDLVILEVQLLPPGSAMYATTHAGTTEVTNSTLVWDIKSPNPDSGDVLVIELDKEYMAGAEVSI